jgi:hypothetical protein
MGSTRVSTRVRKAIDCRKMASGFSPVSVPTTSHSSTSLTEDSSPKVSTKISGTKGPDKISTTNAIKSHGKQEGKEGSASVPVKLSLPVGASDKLDELTHTVSPAKLLSDTDK